MPKLLFSHIKINVAWKCVIRWPRMKEYQALTLTTTFSSDLILGYLSSTMCHITLSPPLRKEPSDSPLHQVIKQNKVNL